MKEEKYLNEDSNNKETNTTIECPVCKIFYACIAEKEYKSICSHCAKERPNHWFEAAQRNGNPLIIKVADTFESALKLLIAKNRDYASDQDPLANFRAVEINGLTDMQTAILVRMSDKWVRICNLHNKEEASVKDESIKDTLLDLINYAAIYLYSDLNFNKEKKNEE